MPMLSIPLKEVQGSLKEFREKQLIDDAFEFKRTKTHLIIALKKRIKTPFKWVKAKLKKRVVKPKNLKEALQNVLTKKQQEELVSSYNVYGSIAVIEIPKSLEKKQKIIAKSLLLSNSNIQTVLKIAGEHGGLFRIQQKKFVLGKRNFIAHYKENGCVFEFDVRKVFFSPTYASERMRVAKLILPDEIVGAFFAGVGPFPIVFAKNSLMKKAIAIELNPDAVKYLKKNIKLNKVEGKVEVIKGDVSKVVRKNNFAGFFDRIVMPLPRNASDFLDSAFFSIKRNGFVHFYEFVPKTSGFEKTIELIQKKARENNKSIEIIYQRIVKEISASNMLVGIDFKVK
ncbi:MAG: hypothetical protein Q7S21_02640 [archaeon]|nr:hypothetical protein [archaeon]